MPADVVPAHNDRAEHAVLVLDEEDVGVAPVPENTVLRVPLLLHEGERLIQGNFGFRFATELSDDRTVDRGLPQPVAEKCLFTDRVFDLPLTREKPLREVFAKVGDLDLGCGTRVANELLFRDEWNRGRRDHDR